MQHRIYQDRNGGNSLYNYCDIGKRNEETKCSKEEKRQSDTTKQAKAPLEIRSEHYQGMVGLWSDLLNHRIITP